MVIHPSTDQAQSFLTSVIKRQLVYLFKTLKIFFTHFSPAHNQLALSKMPEAVARSMKATSVGDFMEAAAPLGTIHILRNHF